ncbi:ABC transporter permease [Siccirubricoccus deserti]|uniref:ABC transporter substrate-binding protein n=1 Tax=Siccirubricoccus deserti TaxID=2013562 RepID=A0A9X0R249_9PROT|nr:ABC transporter substrate-binding protein [Siccirubricoccus deserti]MBC4018155.1 ABC transporter substrate-binding protein [Siccirubricoccus deserti]GGC63265.1 ABC transporter permease [Siccirubricoccus deserti]
MRRAILRAAILVGGLATGLPAVVQAQPAPRREAVRIGIMSDLSGSFADVAGQGSVVAAQLAAEDFGGRAAGLPVQILSGDHQNRADTGSAIARRWFDTEGVDAIIDLPNSAVALAVSEVARTANRVALVTAAVSSRLSGEACSPNLIHYSLDTWSMSNVPSRTLVQQGGDSWFYITADYAFGHDLERQSGEAVTRAGGRVLGTVRHPLGTTDFSSVLLQAQASRASVVALANSQADFINTMKQTSEFGLTRRGQRVVGLAVYISDIVSLGLEATQGAIVVSNFYWDMTDGTRSFGRRFAERMGGRMPTDLQANAYAAVIHYLKAVEALGRATDGRAVVARMKATPTEDAVFGRGAIRPDGRRVSPVYVFQAKAPSESSGRYDVYRLIREVPLEEAYRPLAQGGCPLAQGGG